MLGLCMVCFWCAGCGRKSADQLETFRLEDSRGTEEDTICQETSREREGSESTEEIRDKKAEGNLQEIGNAESDSGGHIFVYVCGAVNSPGVYELEAGARLYEAIARAGGVREDGAEESINQAQTVSDGERLYIPTDEEVRQGLDAYLMSGSAGGDAAAGSRWRSGRQQCRRQGKYQHCFQRGTQDIEWDWGYESRKYRHVPGV